MIRWFRSLFRRNPSVRIPINETGDELVFTLERNGRLRLK